MRRPAARWSFTSRRAADLVFVPFGPVGGHGALIPMGMRPHWASALSLLLAEKANGLVFPTTFACLAGATRTFRGTVSFPIHEQVSVLKRIASTLHAAGLKRTVLVAGTKSRHRQRRLGEAFDPGIGLQGCRRPMRSDADRLSVISSKVETARWKSVGVRMRPNIK